MKPLLKSVCTLRIVKWAVLTLLLAVYVGTYAMLSFRGHYEPNMSWGGLSDVYEFWQPKSVVICRTPVGYDDSGHRVYFYGNTAGYIFMPLVYVDRIFIHTNRPIVPKE
jgi:hypothetical protein